MNRDNRIVYSTEHGQLGKAMDKSSKRKKHKPGKTSTASNIVRPGKQGIRIRRECKSRGGKNVCVIDGLPLDEKEMKALLKKLKGRLGCGGTVRDGSIEIQGDHRQKLLELLDAEGYKARLAGG